MDSRKNSGEFGIVLKKLGQVPGSLSIDSPQILFFGFSLAVAGHIAFFLLPPGQAHKECQITPCPSHPAQGHRHGLAQTLISKLRKEEATA